MVAIQEIQRVDKFFFSKTSLRKVQLNSSKALENSRRKTAVSQLICLLIQGITVQKRSCWWCSILEHKPLKKGRSILIFLPCLVCEGFNDDFVEGVCEGNKPLVGEVVILPTLRYQCNNTSKELGQGWGCQRCMWQDLECLGKKVLEVFKDFNWHTV
jgi:hypothetical protein